MRERPAPRNPKHQQAVGHQHRNRVRIVCDLDPEDFDRIAAAKIAACPDGVMAPKIRTLIELGLEALDEHSPPPRIREEIERLRALAKTLYDQNKA